MESRHSELLLVHRAKFVENVDVEKLISFFKAREILNSHDVEEIRNQSNPSAKTEKFLDILPSKGVNAFATLCLSLESTYPNLLTLMFLSTCSNHKNSDLMSKDSERNEEVSSSADCSSSIYVSPSCSSKCERHNNPTVLKAELKLVTHDRDTLQKELHKVHAERDFLMQDVAMSSSDPLTRLGTLTKQHAASNSDKSLTACRDYDWLKSQCEQAMGELQSLRRQHTDTVRRCDVAMRDSELYRGKHRQAINKIDKQQHESQSLRQQFKETLAEKRRLEEEVMNLRGKEMDEAERHRQKTKNDNSRNEAINQMYNTLLNKYDDLQAEFDNLHKRYTDLLASRSSSSANINSDELAEIRKRYEIALEERNNLTRERNGLSQQCTAAIHKWDTTLRELTIVKESLAKVQQQRDEAMKEINQAMAVRIKATKDLARLTEERNAAVQEYSLVMLERDSVHKEIEKLQEELNESNRRAEGCMKDKKGTLEEVETLRREISSALHDRDRALKECNDLREKYSDYVTGRQEGGEELRGRRDYDTYSRRDSNRKLRSESFGRQDALTGSGDTPSKHSKDKLDNLDQANQELDRLRKQLEKLNVELMEAQQEAEVCKRRRDWAFNERDKIVLERESIRTLCDKLRRERDRAVSDLAEALRDSDDIKKQRNEASKELKELREKMEVQMVKESRAKQLNNISHNHSHDSAIDADLQEWEMETITIDLGGGIDVDQVGFDLGGGKDDPQYPDSSIFITAINKGSIADGKLKINDTVLQINNVDLTNCPSSKALEAIRNGDGFVTVVVRRRHSSRFVQAVQLQLSDEKDHGLSLETGLFISRIAPGSVAAREGGLAIGDRIIHMNGKTMDGLIPANEAMQMLSNANEPVVVAVAKCYTNSISSGNNTEDSMDSPSNKESASRPKEMSKKLITSSCQTDDVETSPKKSTASTQSKFFDRAYQKFFRERRTGKDRSEKKSSQNNSSPSPVHEEEAIAHLDSVIEHFKKNVKPNKARKRKEKEKNNGGTWPRYRANPPIANVEQCVGTVFNPTKRKERISIASLMNNSTKNYHSPIYDNKISDDKSASVSSSYSTLNRTTQSKCKLAADLKDSDQFLSSPKQSPFHPPSSSSLLSKSMTDSKGTMVSSGSVHYSTASSLDSHLDYSVVSANKNVLEYYHRNKVKVRPKSSHYPQGDSESLSAAESPLPPKPSSHDLPSLYSKHPPLHMSSGSMSSTHGGLLSPKTAFSDSPHLSERSQPFVRSPPNSLAYFPVSSGRIPHTHPSHPHPHSPTSSSVKYSSRSGDTLMSSVIPETIPMVRHYHRSDGRYSLTPTSSSSPHSFSHSPSQSLELHHYHQLSAKHLVPKHTHAGYRDELGGYGSYDGPSTFPKRVHQRSRLPSNQSVTSKSSASKVSTSSIERVADEMLPSLHVVTDMQVSNTTASSMPDFRNKKLASGALRSIFIDKSAQPLGIQIDCGAHGGIFVSSVSENSLAAQAGLQIGDQLLEVCGINMRSATYLLAANVLRQCGDSITMLVQYSPDKYKEALETTASCSSSSSSSSRSSDGSPAPTPTPSSSPKTPKNIVIGLDVSDSVPPSANSTLTRQSKPTNKTISDEQNLGLQEPRRVFLKKCTSNLGVSLLGGNAVGIFVHSVQPDSPASGPNGLRCGDQILEYNGIDLRSATAEQAASELAKPAEVISMLAQYNYTRYLEIQEQAGDSFYIRTMFDRVAESPEELSFRKDDILYVDNTMLNGVSGMWRAWLVNDDGQKRKWGLIPSKYKVDEELLLKRSLGELDSDSGSRRGNTSARRSFFRRKKHQRSNSRDSKELASYSDVSINTYGDAGASIGDTTSVSYLRVERLDYLVLRPVLILGPLIEAVVHKLVLDFPLKFQRCLPESIHGSPHTVEKGLEENVFVDYRRRGSHYECITAAAIKEICDNNTHCIIDLSPQSVERLHRQRIYPIVLFIKFKSTKQIREVKDSTFLTEKVSTKAAKEMYEHSLKIENEYKPLISAVIPGGSLAYMCAQIKEVVDQEQSKTLWVRAAGTV